MKFKLPSTAIAVCVGVLFLAASLRAQEAPNTGHIGFPQDWSEHTVIFSLDGLARHPEVLNNELRVQHQLMQRFGSSDSAFFRFAGPAAPELFESATHRDWNQNLNKGRVSANMFPAKYSFDPGAPPSCANDYVVFGLEAAGATNGQANLVAFNNLYAGTGGLCGSAPTVMFAYNVTTVTGGRIITSPVISVDGSKIAFVESVGTTAIFHVLAWTAGQGGITAAVAPTSMVSITLSTTTSDTNSSPWVDYSSDTAYVGSNNGTVYKVTGVFKGTPKLAGSPWPVTVGAVSLSPPVLDSTRGLLMVGSKNGNLYQINIQNGTFGTLVVGAHGGTSPGIVAPPIVDVTDGTTFVVSANNGTYAVLEEVNTSTLKQIVAAKIGLGSSGGTAMSLWEPAFSNNYFNNPSSGTVNLCGTGTADTTPWEYSFGFTGTTMQTVPTVAQQLLTSTAASCTGWTEFYNPNIGGGTDFFFFGLTQDCTGSGTSGCVVEINNSGMIEAAISGGPSGIVVDNYSNAGQASSIYFTAEKANTAYKLTQNGLQ